MRPVLYGEELIKTSEEMVGYTKGVEVSSSGSLLGSLPTSNAVMHHVKAAALSTYLAK